MICSIPRSRKCFQKRLNKFKKRKNNEYKIRIRRIACGVNPRGLRKKTAGGAAFGVSCEGAAQITKIVRAATKKPIMIKLSPNVTNIAEIAKAVEAEGADAVSLINTLLGMRIDIRTKRPILHNNVGGLSGPAVFPVAVRMVWQVANAVKIPVCGMGGISTWEDAVEMMMAGASTVQVGAALFSDPLAAVKIIDGLEKYVEDNHLNSINDIVGAVKPW